MKKNKMMRLASVLLVLTLLSTSVISGTFAKYVTKASTEDTGRVAVWGINGKTENMLLFSYYYYSDTDPHGSSTVLSNGNQGDDIIAPGTTYSAPFKIMWLQDENVDPEVEFEFKFDLTGSSINQYIEDNQNIQWRINWYNEAGTAVDGTWGTWDQMVDGLFATMGAGSSYYTNGQTSYTCRVAPSSSGETISDGRVSIDMIKQLLRGGIIEWKWIFEDANAGTTNANEYTVGSQKLTQDEYDTYMGNLAVTQDLEAKLVVSMTATQID